MASAISGIEIPGRLRTSSSASLERVPLPRDDRAATLFGVRVHGFDAAVERALRDWEALEDLAGR